MCCLFNFEVHAHVTCTFNIRATPSFCKWYILSISVFHADIKIVHTYVHTYILIFIYLYIYFAVKINFYTEYLLDKNYILIKRYTIKNEPKCRVL